MSNYKYSLARKCNSIHVLTSYDIYEDRNSKIIVSEYCNLHSLAHEIAVRNNRGIEKLKAIAILKQIVSGLSVIRAIYSIFINNVELFTRILKQKIY